MHSILSTKGDLEPIKRATVHAALAVEWPARSTCAIKACEAGAAVVSPLQVKTWRLMQTEVACPRWSCPLVAEPMPDAPVVWDLVDNVLCVSFSIGLLVYGAHPHPSAFSSRELVCIEMKNMQVHREPGSEAGDNKQPISINLYITL